jgi:hypothetical protein
VIILAILAGPTIINCSSGTVGIGACIGGKLADMGILGKSAPTVAANTTPAKPTETVAVAQPAPVETKPAAPATQVAATPAPAPAATPADPNAPAFGLVRAQPDGSMVIAGTAQPNAKVQVFADNDVYGSTTADSGGDWALVPEKPLPAGGVEVSVGTEGNAKRSDKSYVVVIDPQHKAEPIVVGSDAGTAADILKSLAAKAPEAAPQAPAAMAAAEKPAVPTTAVPAKSAETAIAAAAPPAPEKPAPVVVPEKPVTAPEPQVAVVAPKAPLPATPDAAALIPPSIDAVEIDKGKDFFAGNGTDGYTIRLYVDDKFIDDAIAQGGRWLVQAENVLTHASQRIRIDMLKPGTADVAARAEVNFVVDQSKPAAPAAAPPPVAVAQAAPEPATPPKPAEPDLGAKSVVGNAASEPAQQGTQVAAQPAPAVAAPAIVAPAVPAPAAPAAAPAPAAPQAATEMPQTPQPDSGPKSGTNVGTAASQPAPATIPAPPVTAEEKPAAVPAPTTEPKLAAVPPVPAAAPPPVAAKAPEPAPLPQPAAPAPEVAAAPAPQAPAAQPTESASIPTLTAEPVGNPDDQRFASGKAIIRRGDNLWTIARRVYGHGRNYTTIYHANDDQIRDPDRIYPGQVFGLPKMSAGQSNP